MFPYDGSLMLMESFKKREKMQVVDAAGEAGSITGYNEHTVIKKVSRRILVQQWQVGRNKTSKVHSVLRLPQQRDKSQGCNLRTSACLPKRSSQQDCLLLLRVCEQRSSSFESSPSTIPQIHRRKHCHPLAKTSRLQTKESQKRCLHGRS